MKDPNCMKTRNFNRCTAMDIPTIIKTHVCNVDIRWSWLCLNRWVRQSILFHLPTDSNRPPNQTTVYGLQCRLLRIICRLVPASNDNFSGPEIILLLALWWLCNSLKFSGGFRGGGTEPALPHPPPLGDGLTPSFTVMLPNDEFWSFYCKTWYSEYSKWLPPVVFWQL